MNKLTKRRYFKYVEALLASLSTHTIYTKFSVSINRKINMFYPKIKTWELLNCNKSNTNWSILAEKICSYAVSLGVSVDAKQCGPEQEIAIDAGGSEDSKKSISFLELVQLQLSYQRPPFVSNPSLAQDFSNILISYCTIS